MSNNKRDISFASVNLYNLQRPGVAMYRGKKYSQAEYDAKIQWTAGILQKIDADVIAFQELWSREALADAFSAAGLAAEYDLAFITDDTWRGIAVAAAVRKPWTILETQRIKQFPVEMKLEKRDAAADEITAADDGDDAGDNQEDEAAEIKIDKFSRSPLRLSIGHSDAADAPAISVYCCHLKSKLATRLDRDHPDYAMMKPHAAAIGAALSTIRRTAEAAALRVILNEAMKDTATPVAVIGDLNDGRLSNTVNIITEQPSYRPYEASRKGSASDRGLYSAAAMQQLGSLSDFLYTHNHHGVREVLDHILVSEQFYDHSRNRHWAFRDMQVWNDYLDDNDKSTSDHGVVRAAFDWHPAG